MDFFGASDEFNEIEHLIESYKKVLLFKQKETTVHRFYCQALVQVQVQAPVE